MLQIPKFNHTVALCYVARSQGGSEFGQAPPWQMTHHNELHLGWDDVGINNQSRPFASIFCSSSPYFKSPRLQNVACKASRFLSGKFLFKISIRGIRTIAKFRLLTKIDFNVMHLINLSKKIWQKLQIRGSLGLQNSAISDTFFQFLTILCSKNASNWFWSTKFAYRRKKITKNSYQNSLQL